MRLQRFRFLWAAGVMLLPYWGSAADLFQEEARYSVPDDAGWTEGAVTLPPYPGLAEMTEFYVGPRERNRYFIHVPTVTVGDDGVVRYVLLVKTPGGGVNVTYEGIRCDTRQSKLYALGRGDAGGWSPRVASDWRLIEQRAMGGHHAVLNRELLCPGGQPVVSPAAVLRHVQQTSYLLER